MSRAYTKLGEPIWLVHLKDDKTGEIIKLKVSASTNEEATHKCSALYGYNEMYKWNGTEPLYE